MELKFVPGRGRAALPWGSNRTFMELKSNHAMQKLLVCVF